MRWRPLIWLVLSLLFLFAVWRWERPHVPPAVRSSSQLPPPQTTVAPQRVQGLDHASGARRHASRLANTSKPLRQLLRCDTAILLENALLDTTQPLDLPIPDSLRPQEAPGSYIVQARAALDDRFRALLASAGATIASYIPNNAYLVRAPAAAAQFLAARPEVQAVLPYEPYYKLKGPLLQLALDQELAAETQQAATQPLNLALLLFRDDRAATLSALAGFRVEILAEESSPLGPLVRIRLPAGALPALAALPGVQELELARRRIAANDLSRATIGVAPDPVTPINYLGLTGTNVLVNVNDTGVDTNHPDLQGRVFADSPNGATDINGHGTHVAGIIAGSGSQSLSVTNAPGSPLPAADAQFRGQAPGASLFSISVALNGPASSDSYLQETAARTNAFISNNSWLYAGDCDYDLAAASYDAAVRDALPAVSGAQPLLCVFAAGNAGAGNDDGLGGVPGTVQSPATAKNVITIGALELPRFITNQTWTCVTNNDSTDCQTNTPWLAPTDSGNQVAGFSSRGNVAPGIEGEFGRFKPDLVAPGTFVISARSTQWDTAAYYDPTNYPFATALDANTFEVLSNLNDGLGPFYRFESGTSLAAAEVSGVLALMQEFFAQRLALGSSPALMKALLINGARSLTNLYDLRVQSPTNFQGWGLINLSNSIPAALTNLEAASRPMFFADQDPGQALATGDSQTRLVSLTPDAQGQPLRVTLVWTDPPGNPVASLKLVNDLDLIVTNLDTGDVFFGNDFAPGASFNQPWNTSTAPNLDAVNNVENVYLSPPLGSHYSVTVVGRRVNVNAVTAQAGKIGQDYALVISSGDGQLPDALTLTGSSAQAETSPAVTAVTNTFSTSVGDVGLLLFHQRIGANSPLLGTNAVPAPGATNGQITLGQTNQWQFYVLTNVNGFTNAAFLTFQPQTLSLPRLGVAAANPANATRTEADLDLYVSTNAGLTNLDPAVVAAADKSLGGGGSETIIYSNAVPGVYYIGIKCEAQTAAEYAFLGVFSQAPFAQADAQGNQLLRGLPVPALVPGGTPACPGAASLLCLSPSSIPLRRVIVTNVLTSSTTRDLVGTLAHRGVSVALNNHFITAPVTGQPFIYDDSGEGDVPSGIPTDGPGSLRDFSGLSGRGQWVLTMTDTNLPATNDSLAIFLERQPDLSSGFAATVLPGACRQDYITLPATVSNFTATAELLSGGGPLSFQLFLASAGPGNSVSLSISTSAPNAVLTLDQFSVPPPNAGLYILRVCNSGAAPASVRLLTSLALAPNPPAPAVYRSAGPTPLLDDAVSFSTITVTDSAPVISAEVGVRINHPRVSDLALTLVSPNGTRVLLSENRGGDSGDGMGFDYPFTNLAPVQEIGGYLPTTNVFDIGQTSGIVTIEYDMIADIPDDMTAYYEGQRILDTGLVYHTGTTNVAFGPGLSTLVTVVMNENTNSNPSDAWLYWIYSTRPEPLFLTFTDNTNFTATPIKFATPPFTNLTYSTLGPPPVNGIFYLPEESLAKLAGQSPSGQWTLEVADTCAGAASPSPVLLSWQLALTLENLTPVPISLSHGVAFTNILGPGCVQWFSVDAPAWASFATNSLLAASAPLDLLFNASQPPTGTNAGDVTFLAGALAGTWTLQTNSLPAFMPGGRYYLGLRNTNALSVTAAMEVDFDVIPLTRGQLLAGTLTPGPLPRYYSFEISSNATSASFQLLSLTGDANLVARRGLPFPTPASYEAASFLPGTNSEEIALFANSIPVPIAPGRWYLGVFNADTTNVSFDIRAADYTNGASVSIPTLSSGEPFPGINEGPAGSVDYYRFVVATNAVRAQFEIIHPTADVTLVARRGFPLPTLTDYDFISANWGTNDELIVLYDYSRPIPLQPGEWFLGVVNLSGVTVGYNVAATQFASHGTNVVLSLSITNSGSFCLTLTWNSLQLVHYYVQGKTNLLDPQWTTLSPTLTAYDVFADFCVPLPSPFHFFRVGEGLAIVPPPPPPPPPVISSLSVSTNGMVLRWSATNCAQLRFQVQWTPSLGPPSWQTFTNTLVSTNCQFEFLDDGSQSSGLGSTRYYRLLQLPGG